MSTGRHRPQLLLSLSDSWRTSLEGFDLVGLFSTHCKLPIGDKLFPVELNPRLEKLHLVQTGGIPPPRTDPSRSDTTTSYSWYLAWM